jgi:hypothetical protein
MSLRPVLVPMSVVFHNQIAFGLFDGSASAEVREEGSKLANKHIRITPAITKAILLPPEPLLLDMFDEVSFEMPEQG